MGLIGSLQKVVVRGTLNLTELDEAYRDPETKEPLTLDFRLNWAREQKERQRDLQQETLELQRAYVALKDLVDDHEAWRAAKDEADRLSDENWLHWAEWWSGILLMEVEEVIQLADAIPEQHWVWVTSQVAQRAGAYEEAAVKKAAG